MSTRPTTAADFSDIRMRELNERLDRLEDKLAQVLRGLEDGLSQAITDLEAGVPRATIAENLDLLLP